MYFFIFACQPDIPNTQELAPPLTKEQLAIIDPYRMQNDVVFLTDDELGGRIPGSFGHRIARDYILAEVEEIGLTPLRLDGGFIQTYSNDPIDGRYQMEEDGSIIPSNVTEGFNIIGAIPGSDPELADEYIVLMTHYDHLGVTTDGEVFNGAMDNASSVAMALEMARIMLENELQVGRTIVFLFTDDEESGLDGAQAWLEDPNVPIGDVIFGISVDPAGRGLLPDFWPIVLIGLERSPALLARWRKTTWYSEVPVYFVHRDAVPVFASDHDRFFSFDKPALWYTNPGMSFYHTVNDTAETVDYRVMLSNVKYLSQLIYEFSNEDERFTYEGEQPINAQSAQDLLKLFEGIRESSYLTSEEKDRADFYIEEISKVVESDDVNVLTSPDGIFWGGAYFMLFELTSAHPGEVPPPFPEYR
jgi:hypothetical protein